MNKIALIPARGGSKGIKGKNLVNLGGKPLIAHSIEAGFRSNLVDRVVVSSENEEILRCARQYGAEVPFIRPNSLAEDHILDLPVFLHAIDALQLHDDDLLVHLRPTSPYRREGWIDECVQRLLDQDDATSVRSVHEIAEHPYRAFTLNPSTSFLEQYLTEVDRPYEVRRQDWPNIYFYNCVIDVTRVSTIRNFDSMVGPNISPFIISEQEVFDIDTHRDLHVMRSLWESLPR